MKKNLLFFLLGGSISIPSFIAYQKLHPEKGMSEDQHKLIEEYQTKNNLIVSYSIMMGKLRGLIQQSIYHFGLIDTLQGYNYHSLYLNKTENQSDKIEKIYCIFSPKSILCGHPSILHGGISAMIIDQSLGALGTFICKTPVATKQLDVKYLKPIIKDQLYVFQGQLAKKEGKYMTLTGKIKQLKTGITTVDSSLTFKSVQWGNTFTALCLRLFLGSPIQNL